MKLNLRRKSKKRLPARVKRELFQPAAMNEVWSIDFMSDSLWNGRKIRLLNVIDDYNREIICKNKYFSFTRVITYFCNHRNSRFRVVFEFCF